VFGSGEVASVSELDRKLFACHRSPGYTESEWREIVSHVVGKLENTLAQPVGLSGVDFFPDGFAGDIKSLQPFAGLLGLSWFGRIGATVVGRREATFVEATIFLRGVGERLVTSSGKAYLWLRYEEAAPGVFGWREPIWLPDEFGEYESWE
jgi:hypothetical protein